MTWQDKFIDKVICEDVIKTLQQIPDGVVDLILTDPPYMISNEVKITRGRNKMKFKGKDLSHNFGDWDKFNSLDEFMQWTFKWADEAARVLRDGGMFCSYFDRDKVNFISRYLQDKHGFKTKGYYADCKSNPVPQARKVKWMNGWEIIGMWQKPGGKLTYNYQLGQAKDWGARSIVGHITKADGERIHPTQKPRAIGGKFIAYWSNPGDLFLDCFCGSGAFLVAAKSLGRHFIGIDKEKKYVEASEMRLNNTITDMFV